MSQYHRYVAHSGIQLMHREVVLFMRHGLCHSNIEWPIPDYSDEKDGLTTVGVEQAKLTANWLRAHFPSERWIVALGGCFKLCVNGHSAGDSPP